MCAGQWSSPSASVDSTVCRYARHRLHRRAGRDPHRSPQSRGNARPWSLRAPHRGETETLDRGWPGRLHIGLVDNRPQQNVRPPIKVVIRRPARLINGCHLSVERRRVLWLYRRISTENWRIIGMQNEIPVETGRPMVIRGHPCSIDIQRPPAIDITGSIYWFSPLTAFKAARPVPIRTH